MKNITLAALALITISFTSCKKCYTCESALSITQICKGDLNYSKAATGKKIVDEQGNSAKCY